MVYISVYMPHVKDHPEILRGKNRILVAVKK
jgi:hypothetical protein